jgi:hypothetical protein
MDQNCSSFTASIERYSQLVENGVVVNDKRFDIPAFSARTPRHPMTLSRTIQKLGSRHSRHESQIIIG